MKIYELTDHYSMRGTGPWDRGVFYLSLKSAVNALIAILESRQIQYQKFVDNGISDKAIETDLKDITLLLNMPDDFRAEHTKKIEGSEGHFILFGIGIAERTCFD